MVWIVSGSGGGDGNFRRPPAEGKLFGRILVVARGKGERSGEKGKKREGPTSWEEKAEKELVRKSFSL